MTDSSTSTSVDPMSAHALAVFNAQRRARGGAGWFLWIAGLSLVNSGISSFGGDMAFIVGLGSTQMIDAVAAAIRSEVDPSTGDIVRIIAMVADFVVASLFGLFGWQARKGREVVYAVGMGLYALDGLLFVAFGDWIAVGFHLFALYWLFVGLRALRSLPHLRGAQPQSA